MLKQIKRPVLNRLSKSLNHSVVFAVIMLLNLSVIANAKEIKVLTIGNSFADSVFEYLPKIVQSVPDCKIVMGRANIR